MHRTPLRHHLPALILLVMGLSSTGQGQANAQTLSQSTGDNQIVQAAERSGLDLGRTNLQCTGYFRLPPLKNLPQIVGAEQEQEKTAYASGDIVYINAGSQQGLREGQEFHIIRPRGQVKSVYQQKKGFLGVFVQEIGQLRVVRVKHDVSVAQLTFSCDLVLFGDLLTGVPDRVSPQPQPTASLDRFADPNGRPTGRILMSRDQREMITTGDLIYIDIGNEDKAVAGDYVTIYRRVGKGNLTNGTDPELAPASDPGFASEHFRGGDLSLNTLRSKDVKDEEGIYRWGPLRTPDVKHKRPELPRKIVGEALIINVQVRTATAIIMRIAQEVHTGDFVELR